MGNNPTTKSKEQDLNNLKQAIKETNYNCNTDLFLKKTSFLIKFEIQFPNNIEIIINPEPKIIANMYNYYDYKKVFVSSIILNTSQFHSFHEACTRMLNLYKNKVESRNSIKSDDNRKASKNDMDKLKNNNNVDNNEEVKEEIFESKKEDINNKNINESQVITNILMEEDEELCPICDERKPEVVLECLHTFCEECIKSWLYNKKNDCPLCRKSFDLSKYDELTWDLVDINQKEYAICSNIDFYTLFYDIFLEKS